MTEYRKARDPYAELGIAPTPTAPRPVASAPSPSFAPAAPQPAAPAPPLRAREDWRPAPTPSPSATPAAAPERVMRPAPQAPARGPIPVEPEAEAEPARPARLQIRTTARIEALILAEIARRCAEGSRGRGKANRTVVVEEAIERTYGHLIPGQEK